MSGPPSTELHPGSNIGFLETRVLKLQAFIMHMGAATMLARNTATTLVTTRFEGRAVLFQMYSLGVESLAIAGATALFVGIVMTIQFGFAMEQFGAVSNLGRVITLSEARELAPSLTSLVVGSRIAAGMAAELGSMKVTEQVDAIRALGADPIKKLVVPRVVAGTIVLPLICALAFLVGCLSASFVAAVSYGMPPVFFFSTALDAVTLQDFTSGLAKTPFFGFLIALLGCYFGLGTTGGTEGVGRATTRAVVVVSMAVLVADAFLTQVFLAL